MSLNRSDYSGLCEIEQRAHHIGDKLSHLELGEVAAPEEVPGAKLGGREENREEGRNRNRISGRICAPRRSFGAAVSGSGTVALPQPDT